MRLPLLLEPPTPDASPLLLTLCVRVMPTRRPDLPQVIPQRTGTLAVASGHFAESNAARTLPVVPPPAGYSAGAHVLLPTHPPLAEGAATLVAAVVAARAETPVWVSAARRLICVAVSPSAPRWLRLLPRPLRPPTTIWLRRIGGHLWGAALDLAGGDRRLCIPPPGACPFLSRPRRGAPLPQSLTHGPAHPVGVSASVGARWVGHAHREYCAQRRW